MSLHFATDMVRTYNNGRLCITLTEPTRPHCDNCAADLPGAYLASCIEGELVRLCSARCTTELARVWAPARRMWPWTEALLGVAACLTVVGIVLSL